MESYSSLEEVLNNVKKIVAEIGVDLIIKKVHVDTRETALKVGFLASPTIRINGYDIQEDIHEETCESGQACVGEDTNCRTWLWHGKTYSVLPHGVVIDAIFKAIYGEPKPFKKVEPLKELPKNLEDFYAARIKFLKRQEAFGF